MSSEPTNPSGLPGRSRPALSDLSRETTESDLWNLDEELAERPIPQVSYPPQPRKGHEPASGEDAGDAPPEQEPIRPRGRTPLQNRPEQVRRTERLAKPDEIGELDEEEEGSSEAPEDEPAAELRVVPEPELEPRTGLSLEKLPPRPVVEPVLEDTKDRSIKQNQRRGASEPKRASAGVPLPRPRLNRREILGLAAFAFALLLAAIWVLTRFFSAFEFKSDFVKEPDFPIKGEHVALDSADIYWREPVRTGDARDFARREVSLIPVLDLTLDPESTTNGSLLVIFRNSEGQPVGDSIRRSFAGGRFDGSGNATISFPATDGFVAEGDFNAYRSGKGDAWMAEVFEGPSVDAPADQFKPLATIPVLPKLR